MHESTSFTSLCRLDPPSSSEHPTLPQYAAPPPYYEPPPPYNSSSQSSQQVFPLPSAPQEKESDWENVKEWNRKSDVEFKKSAESYYTWSVARKVTSCLSYLSWWTAKKTADLMVFILVPDGRLAGCMTTSVTSFVTSYATPYIPAHVQRALIRMINRRISIPVLNRIFQYIIPPALTPPISMGVTMVTAAGVYFVVSPAVNSVFGHFHGQALQEVERLKLEEPKPKQQEKSNHQPRRAAPLVVVNNNF